MTDPNTAEIDLGDMSKLLARHPVHHIAPVGSRYAFGRVHRDRAALTGYRMELGKRTRAALKRLQGIEGASKRLLIVARPRSGTSLLVDLLKQVPDMRCDGEMLHFAVHNPARLLSALARTCVQPAYGCKVLSYQFFEIQQMRDPLRFLKRVQDDGFRLIHLRRSTFDQCLSLSRAQKTKHFHNRSGADDGPEEITIDEDLFRQQVVWNAAMLDYEDKLLSALPHLRLQYEEHLATPEAQQRTIDQVCAAISHPTGKVSARLKKISAGKTVITNLERLKTLANELAPGQG